jgi:glycerate 2-kinase
MVAPEKFLTHTLKTMPQGEMVARILSRAVQSVDPETAVHQYVSRTGDTLDIGGTLYDLESYRRVFVVGAGKASQSMAKAITTLIDEHLTGGVVIGKTLDPAQERMNQGRINFLQGSHPVPDDRSLASTQTLLQLLQGLHEDDLVICLLSGGASALMTLPEEGIDLADLQALTRQLLACGATINEINSLRKHLDLVKGGRLAGRVYPARLATLILSDVVGNLLDVIASGPTVADTTTFNDALTVLQKYQLFEDAPETIKNILLAGVKIPAKETLKQGDPRLDKVQNIVVGSNYQAASSVVQQARREGLNSEIITTYLQGEARHASGCLTAMLKQVVSSDEPFKRPCCLVVGGETTVVVKGMGKGGRNQELALGAVDLIDGLKNVLLVTLATDGEDGPTDAAGAVVTGETARRAYQAGMKAMDYLLDNNAYNYFDRLGDLIKTGSTGTNVNDLALMFAF